MSRYIFTILLSIFTSSSVLAQTSNNMNQEDLNILNNKFVSLKNNAQTPFQKWYVDMLHFSIASCATQNNLSIPTDILEYEVSKGGSYTSMPKEICPLLLKNTDDPVCVKVNINNAPFISTPNGFMRDQGLFLPSTAKVPPAKSSLPILASCLLIPNEYKTVQLFYGDAIIDYKPMMTTTFTLPEGNKKVLQSTVFFYIQGLPKHIGPTNLIKLLD